MPQSSALDPTMLATINYIHNYANNSTLNASLSFNEQVPLTELNFYEQVVAAALSKDFNVIIEHLDKQEMIMDQCIFLAEHHNTF